MLKTQVESRAQRGFFTFYDVKYLCVNKSVNNEKSTAICFIQQFNLQIKESFNRKGIIARARTWIVIPYDYYLYSYIDNSKAINQIARLHTSVVKR